MRRNLENLSVALSFVVATSLVAGMSCAASASPARHGAQHAHRISMAQARKTALARVPGKLNAEELEHEHGRWIYSFEIRVKGDAPKMIHEVNVDADTGRIVDVSTERD